MSALLSKGSGFARTILEVDRQFFIGELVLAELFEHKERIVQHSRLPEREVVTLFYELCRDVDETDTPHVALTLELDGLLWTGDEKLKEGLQEKGFDRFYEREG